MSEIGVMTDERFAELHGPSEHPAGCSYGGFSCGYWLITEGCELDHWERHFVHDDACPCGNSYPGAGTDVVFTNASQEEPASQ